MELPRKHSLGPLLIISAALGAIPYNGDFARTRKTTVFITFLTILYGLKFAFQTWYHIERRKYIQGTTHQLLVNFQNCYDIAPPILHIISMWANAYTFEKLGHFLSSLQLVENHCFRIPRTHTCLGLIYICIDALPLLIFENEDEFILHCSLFGKIDDIFTFLIIMQFSSILEILNYHLNLSVTQLALGRLESRTSKQLEFIKAASRVNDLYALQNVAIFVKTFLNLTQYSFSTIWNIRQAIRTVSSYHISRCCRSSLYFMLHLYIAMIVTGSCMHIKTEIKLFNEELFKMLREKEVLCKNVLLRLYVQMKPSLNFSAFGFFNIDYPLVTSIGAAVTSYLVIILQLGDSS